jgi:hypothetical protein
MWELRLMLNRMLKCGKIAHQKINGVIMGRRDNISDGDRCYYDFGLAIEDATNETKCFLNRRRYHF